MNWNILVTRGKEIKRDSESSGERNRTSRTMKIEELEWSGKFNQRQWQSGTGRNNFYFWVGRGTWNPVWIRGDHPPRLSTPNWPIVHQYCEGKVKRTPNGEWNRTWNRMLTSSQRERVSWWRTFCIMGQRLSVTSELKPIGVGEAKASLNRAFSLLHYTRNRVI